MATGRFLVQGDGGVAEGVDALGDAADEGAGTSGSLWWCVATCRRSA